MRTSIAGGGKPPGGWVRDGARQVLRGPAGVLGWYHHTGYRWGVFMPGRSGWCEQLADTESEARALVEARAGVGGGLR